MIAAMTGCGQLEPLTGDLILTDRYDKVEQEEKTDKSKGRSRICISSHRNTFIIGDKQSDKMQLLLSI